LQLFLLARFFGEFTLFLAVTEIRLGQEGSGGSDKT
jgi:hypothetical protein